MNIIPIEVKKKCVEMSKQGKTSREIYTEYYSKHYDTAYEGFRSMLKRWKKKSYADNEILETGNLGYNYTPHAATVQIGRDGEIVQSWIKSKAVDRLYLELIEAVKENTPYKEINLIENKESSTMLEINLCDLHYGIADLEHYKETLNSILNLISCKHYKKILLIIGQDQLHNDNFQGTTTRGTVIEKVDMAKAWEDAKTFWYNIIDLSVTKSNEVEIVYVPGNHDRTLTWAFMQMIKERYQDLKIDDSLDKRKCVTFGSNFIGLTHGEFKRSKPADLRSQFSVLFPIEFASSTVREIHCSHLHTEINKDEYGVMIRRMSTAGKDDDWSKDEGYIGNNKRFMIFEWSLEKLVAIYYV